MDDLSKLMLEAQKGKEGSYSELLLKTSMIMDSYLAKKIKSSDERDELINTILSSCHNNRHTYTPDISYHAWLFSIAKIHMKTYFKTIGKTQTDILNKKIEKLKFKIYPPPLIKTVKSTTELRNILATQFNKRINFPSLQIKILNLLIIQNESFEDISKKLKVNVINIKIITFRILQNFEEEIDEN